MYLLVDLGNVGLFCQLVVGCLGRVERLHLLLLLYYVLLHLLHLLHLSCHPLQVHLLLLLGRFLLISYQMTVLLLEPLDYLLQLG